MNASTGQMNPMNATGQNKIPPGYARAQVQQYTPEQMDLFRQLLQQTGPDSYLSKLSQGDENTFSQMEAPAMRQFNQLQGNTAARFSGMGDFGQRNSTGFQHEMNSASSNFAQDLQGKRMGIQRQALMDLLGLSNELLGQRPYNNMLIKKNPGLLEELLGGLAGAGVGAAGGYATGGPTGAWLGGMSGFGNAYGGR